MIFVNAHAKISGRDLHALIFPHLGPDNQHEKIQYNMIHRRSSIQRQVKEHPQELCVAYSTPFTLLRVRRPDDLPLDSTGIETKMSLTAFGGHGIRNPTKGDFL
jgi:hypothetical protein